MYLSPTRIKNQQRNKYQKFLSFYKFVLNLKQSWLNLNGGAHCLLICLTFSFRQTALSSSVLTTPMRNCTGSSTITYLPLNNKRWGILLSSILTLVKEKRDSGILRCPVLVQNVWICLILGANMWPVQFYCSRGFRND